MPDTKQRCKQMLKDDFKQWMKKTTLKPETQEKYVLYLNGLFVMLQEDGFMPFDGWVVLNRILPVKANKTKLLSVCSIITDAIEDAENKGYNFLNDFKSAFHKLESYIQSI